MEKNKLNVVFFGTPDFSVPTLDLLNNHPLINLKTVVTMPDRPAGRGCDLKSPPVAEYARQEKINLIQTDNINNEFEFINSFKSGDIDLFIVLAFAQFLNEELLHIPKLGCFNIHTSLLPKYRGAAPIQYAILNGDKHTGVSIQKMVKKMDAGDLVHSNKLEISPEETGGQLYTRLKFQAALSTNDFLEDLVNDRLTFVKQNEANVSFAPTLKKDDGLINFKDNSSETILRKIRALSPWPGTYCFLGTKRLKIISASPYHSKLAPNQVNTDFGNLIIGCSEGSLRLETIQLPGKKACSDVEFLNGIREKIIINP